VIKLKKRPSATLTETHAVSPPKPQKLIPIQKLKSATAKPAKSSIPADSQQLLTQLFSDVKSIFISRKTNKLRTQAILEALIADKHGVWATRGIDARKLSVLLTPYGIHSKDLKFERGKTYKGYKREWFKVV